MSCTLNCKLHFASPCILKRKGRDPQHSPLPNYFTARSAAPEATYTHFVHVVELSQLLFRWLLFASWKWAMVAEFTARKPGNATHQGLCKVLFCLVCFPGEPVVKYLPALLWVKLANKVGCCIVRQVLMVRIFFFFFITLRCVPSCLNSS